MPIAAPLLWDLDNVITRAKFMPHLAAVLAHIAGPGTIKIAAARRSTARKWAPMLREHGFETVSGGRAKSGADYQLRAQAAALHGRGAHAFTLASNDGDLARLARWGPLRVVTLSRSHLSGKLARHADSILVLSGHTG